MRLRRSHSQLYLHIVWGTWDRLPLITPELRPRLYANVVHHAKSVGAEVFAIGGIEDHVHVLMRFPTTITVADLAMRIKGGSSHFVTHVLRHPDAFKWQGGYGAFTLSRRGIPIVREYVLNQETHHRDGTLFRDLERTDTHAPERKPKPRAH